VERVAALVAEVPARAVELAADPRAEKPHLARGAESLAEVQVTGDRGRVGGERVAALVGYGVLREVKRHVTE
jgi:hypothetical protein